MSDLARLALLPLALLLTACPVTTDKPPAEEEEDTDCTATTWYLDEDGDGYGDAAIDACERPAGAATSGDDCDDADADVHPDAVEACDGADDNCDGVLDDGLVLTDFYADADGDGAHGGDPVQACAAPTGTSATATDCDDDDPALHPGAAEVCDAIDNDCDDLVDDADDDAAGIYTYYLDADHDGFGLDDATITACAPVEGYSLIGGDCDDEDEDVRPGSDDECDDIDDDCDGDVDEDASFSRYYQDRDNDGYGDADVDVAACRTPSGYVTNATDCDDRDDEIYPRADERCNEVDDDCDGRVDDGVDCDDTGGSGGGGGSGGDTGIAVTHWIGDGVTSAGAWSSGTFGLAWYGLATGAEVCAIVGDWYEDGAPPRRLCPSCDWGFDLNTQSSVASGSECTDFGISDGDLDGLHYGWGFATTASYYGYSLENAVYLYYDGAWSPFAFNYAGGGTYMVTGDQYSFTFDRENYGGYYYYYP